MDTFFLAAALDDFLRGDYMPHGHCFLWQPGILWLTVISDLVIGVAYFLISGALIHFVRKRKDLKFRGLFFLFGSFILWCGVTHLFAIHTIWHGAYGVMALIKFITAIVSGITALVLITNFKHILQIPNIKEHQAALNAATQKESEAKQLEAQAKAESIFRFAIELLPTGLLVLNHNKEIVIANEALEKMFAYERGELIGQSISALLNPSQSEHHELLVENYLNNPSQDHAMAAGRVVNGRSKLGEDVAIEISLSVYELDGSPHAFASVVDINRAQEQERKLVETSNRLNRAIEATNDGIWEWNIQTNDVWYSDMFMQHIGHNSHTEIPALEFWLDHIHPEDKENIRSKLDLHFKNRNKYDVIYRGRAKSGNYEWMHVRGDTVFDKDESPLLMSGTLTNINEKKILEEKLAEKTFFLNAVLEKSLCGIYVFDLKENKNIYINEQYKTITGYNLERLNVAQSDSLIPLFHPEDQENIFAHFDNVINSHDDQGESIDYRFRHAEGYWIWCYSRDSVYLRDEKGEATQMIGTFFDITEIKSAQKSLAQSNASLERFAYSASHDLQEPLRKISAFSSSLQERLKNKLEDAEALYELDRIANASSRMREMIDSLLQLSRYSRKKLNIATIKFSELAAIIQDDLSELITENQAEISVGNSVELSVDINSFEQVLRNLVTNSIRYAKQGETVRIDLNSEIKDAKCVISVRDNGSGFNQNSAEEIFEPFKRLVGRNITGSGMGLSICRQIVEAHGGLIYAKSEREKGAVFTIELPLNNINHG